VNVYFFGGAHNFFVNPCPFKTWHTYVILEESQKGLNAFTNSGQHGVAHRYVAQSRKVYTRAKGKNKRFNKFITIYGQRVLNNLRDLPYPSLES